MDDSLDLDVRVLWEGGNLDGGPSGRGVGKVFRIDAVHRSEVVHVLQEDGRLDDAFETGPGRLCDRPEIF